MLALNHSNAQDLPSNPDVSAEVVQGEGHELDKLFDQLAALKPPVSPRRYEQQIDALWMQSGSETADLFMLWAGQATAEKQYGRALDYLDNAIRLRPTWAEAWNKRATVFYLSRDFGASIADVEQVLRLEPRHYKAMAGLSSILDQIGRKKEARDVMRRAVAINPASASLRKQLEELEKAFNEISL